MNPAIQIPNGAADMDDTGRSIFVATLSGKVYTKAIGRELNAPIVSIVTYPTSDYDNDRIKPDGGDWSAYPAHPYVNWNHRCPIGRGSIKHQTLHNNGQSYPVAVGTTTFFKDTADIQGIDLRRRNPKTHRSWDKEPPYTADEALTVSRQAAQLIRDDIATGVSVELDVDDRAEGTDWWNLPSQSLLSNRPAKHFERWKGLGYAHTRQPVNPGCHTVAGAQSDTRLKAGAPQLKPSSQEAVEKAVVIAQTGRFPGGEIVCKAIMDDFLELRSYRSNTVSVQGTPPTETPLITGETIPLVNPQVAALTQNGIVVVKGDTQEGMTANTATAERPKGMSAGHSCAMNSVQALSDVCTSLEDSGSDDLSFRKYLKRQAAKLKDIAGDIKARTVKHKARLEGDGSGADADDDPMDEDDYEPSTEEKSIELDEKGAIIVKSFPDWKPRRVKFDEIGPVEEVPAPTAIETKSISPEEEARLLKKVKKTLKKYQPYLDAMAANGKL